MKRISRVREKGISAADGNERMSLFPACGLSQGVRVCLVAALMIALLIGLAPRAQAAVKDYQVQNILADLSLDTVCNVVKVELTGPETIEMIESATAGCSGGTAKSEDKIKFTVSTTAETHLLTAYFDNGGYASNMIVTCQSSGNEIYFKSKAIGGTFKIYLYEANPDTGALIGDPLDTHTETVTLNVAHIWTDLTGLEGVVSSGNTFAFKMSFTPTDATSSDIETKFGAYGEAGKQMLFNIDETAVTTTLGDGTDPTDSTVAPGSADQYLDQFTFIASADTDSVDTLTVTTANTAAVASIEIWDNTKSTQYFSTVSDPGGDDTWDFSGGTAIPVTTSSTPFRIYFTAKDHSLAAGTYAVTGTVTSFSCTNAQLGTDTDSATITVDNSPPGDATWGTITPGVEQVELNWTNPGTDFYRVLIIRNTVSITDAPTEGTEYVQDNTIDTSTVRYVGSLETFTDTGLTGGTDYYYKIFAYDTYINYASGAGTGPHTPSEPVSAAVSGTITPSASESDIVSGGKTIIITLTNDTWIATVGADNAITTALINGITAYATPDYGWNNVVKANMTYEDVDLSSATVVEITLGPEATYSITAQETIKVTVPASALVTSSSAVVATPTFGISGSSVTEYQVQNILADLSLDTVCSDVKVELTGPETIEMIESATAGCSGGTAKSEDKVKFTVASMDEAFLLTAYFDNGGYASDTTVTCQSSGNEIYFKAKDVGGTFKIYLYNANPDTGALIGDYLDIHSETVTTGEAHIWTDLTGLEGEISSGNTFAFKISFTPTDTTSSDIETKFGAYGESGKQLLLNVQESAAYVAPSCKFEYRRPIVIDHTKVGVDDSGTLPATGFPVLISLTGNWLKTTLVDATNGRIENANGYDIIFRESDGVTGLYHEIESYDGTNGTLVAWVRINSLSKAEDTTIYMYYGNACITTPTENPENVWDTSFKGVWHMKEEETGIVTDDLYIDSTSNSNDGDDRVSATLQDGKIYNGQQFDGNDDYVGMGDVLDYGKNDPMTYSAWIKTGTGERQIAGKADHTGNWQGVWFYLIGSSLSFQLYDSAGNYIYKESTETFADNQWHHVAAAYDGTDSVNGITLYGDGSELSISDSWNDTLGTVKNSYPFNIGSVNDGAAGDFNGYIDEVRVSSADRSADWIRTCYNNQVWPNKASTPDPLPDPNPGSGFITVDSNEEFNVATAVGLISFTATGQDESVLVSWETAQEIDNLGFNLYRSTEVYGTYTKLNRRLIPGLISSVSGQQYTYTDTDVTRSVLYYYMLEDVDLSGTRTMHGPVCVDWDNDGIPDDYYEEEDDDTDTGEEEPEVSIPDTGFDELELDLSDWTPSSSSATWVKLASFKARQEDEGIALEWETSLEVDILGFHVYREVDGKFYRVTADLVPGSVFKVGAGRELPAGQSYGQSYVYWDGLSEGRGDELYWLDSVELNGGRASFGPIRPEIYGQPVPKRIKARFRSIGKHQRSRARALGNIRALREELSAKPAITHKFQVNLVQAVPEKSSGPRLLPGEEQWALAAQPGVKIYIKEDGWYRVGEPEVAAAGLSPGVDPRYLQLYADGEEQCLMVTGSDDGRFDPEDALEFYGTGLDTPFTAAHVYWLVVGSRPGRRLDTPFTDIRLNLGKRMRIPRGLRGRGAPLSFPFSVELKERTFYFAALTNGESENFFGSVISTEPVDQLLTVAHPDPSSPEDALLEVVLQGGTVASHQIKILFNYVEVGEVVFSGQEQWRAEIEVPHDLLLEGDNIITLTAQGGSMDVSMVDYIRLTYWRTYTADEDALRFRASGGEWLSIGGFSSPEIQVRDITDPMRMLKVRGKVMTQDSGYAITIKVPRGGERSLMAFTEDKIKRPAGIAANLASSWHELSQGAEVIIIGHSDLFESVRFLKELREQQGWSVVLVDVEDLYDEFNFGAKSPWALKDFLAQAYAYWNPQPRFVVLVGDTSYDPRNYLGFGEFDLVPTKFVDTKYLKTASDDWFVDFDDDELPEMAVGRLPVESAEETTTVVSKIISYEGASGLMNEALLVADINDFFDFEGASGDVGSLLPGNITVREVFRGQSPTARSDLLDSLNQGQLLVNYIGHGSAKIWKGNLLTSLDAWNLTNSPYLPFLVSMTCLNGFFQDPYSESMAETFLKAERGGAVAVWTSSGLTDPEGQIVMNKELILLLFNGQGLTIGEAIMRAKQVVTDGDIRKTWILFGDPTLRLK
jgi:hypothetical protein